MNEAPSEAEGTPQNTFQTRLEALQARVNKAALALHERNVRPTVTRIRAALGGGSPNDLGPAVKRWRDEVLPALAGGEGRAPTGVPPVIADIVAELWMRATAAAAVEAVGGSAARYRIARTEEAKSLRDEVQHLRDQLQREQQAFGELRAQAARHEAVARDALSRVREGELRQRKALTELGQCRQRVASLEATSAQTAVRPKRTAAGRADRIPTAKRSRAMKPSGKAKSKSRRPKRPTKATRPVGSNRRR